MATFLKENPDASNGGIYRLKIVILNSYSKYIRKPIIFSSFEELFDCIDSLFVVPHDALGIKYGGSFLGVGDMLFSVEIDNNPVYMLGKLNKNIDVKEFDKSEPMPTGVYVKVNSNIDKDSPSRKDILFYMMNELSISKGLDLFLPSIKDFRLVDDTEYDPVSLDRILLKSEIKGKTYYLLKKALWERK